MSIYNKILYLLVTYTLVIHLSISYNVPIFATNYSPAIAMSELLVYHERYQVNT